MLSCRVCQPPDPDNTSSHTNVRRKRAVRLVTEPYTMAWKQKKLCSSNLPCIELFDTDDRLPVMAAPGHRWSSDRNSVQAPAQHSKKPYNARLRSSAGLSSWSQFKTNVAFFSSWVHHLHCQYRGKKQCRIDTTPVTLKASWIGIVSLFWNLWKDSEKSMRSSKPGPYYFEHKKKHLESPLSAWFHYVICGGRYKFRTCDPCSVKTPTSHHFPV